MRYIVLTAATVLAAIFTVVSTQDALAAPVKVAENHWCNNGYLLTTEDHWLLGEKFVSLGKQPACKHYVSNAQLVTTFDKYGNAKYSWKRTQTGAAVTIRNGGVNLGNGSGFVKLGE